MYATNLVNLMRALVKQGAVSIDLNDEIIRETLVTHQGKVVHPRIASLVGEEVASS
jgi:H+-translocating NAD(P) transhydrogenase subunit alpha